LRQSGESSISHKLVMPCRPTLANDRLRNRIAAKFSQFVPTDGQGERFRWPAPAMAPKLVAGDGDETRRLIIFTAYDRGIVDRVRLAVRMTFRHLP